MTFTNPFSGGGTWGQIPPVGGGRSVGGRGLPGGRGGKGLGGKGLPGDIGGKAPLPYMKCY